MVRFRIRFIPELRGVNAIYEERLRSTETMLSAMLIDQNRVFPGFLSGTGNRIFGPSGGRNAVGGWFRKNSQ